MGERRRAVGSRWASDIPDPGLRQRLISAIAVASAKLNGAAAAEMVASLLPPGDEQNRAAVAVVHRWAQVSTQAAAAWALYPEGSTPVTAAAILSQLPAAQESAITAGEAGNR
jgi:hypothetical protein